MHNYLPFRHRVLTMLLLRSSIRADVNWALRLGLMGLLSSSCLVAQAQEQASITGIIKDEAGRPIPSATVTVHNAASGLKKSTTSRPDGTFALDQIPPGQGYKISISSIGYQSKELTDYTITERDKLAITISLESVAENLQEVVVTALGIKREKKALGYTVAELKGDELTQGKETNVANALSGKVAGVQVSRAASGAGGSSKVVIRGNNSLIGNSQPLYVVDGVPIDNQNISSPNQSGGTDYGDGIGNINPEDIETMSVLKGPNAAALYGQRGSNGVILITTKSGKAGKTRFNYGTDFSLGNALVLPDFQNVYGQGLNGTFTHFRKDDGTIVSMSDALKFGYSGLPKMSAGRDRTTRGSWVPKWKDKPTKMPMVMFCS
ncbi:TonB-dependent receptor plug domain-containing protein [Sphingobacterium thalpophilum]|uniref:TonB-dependent receptor plug domain-containing protein n=1 Tax=Sphingobacterium thalpophilum TaxID=259 RepID=UPI003DA313FF